MLASPPLNPLGMNTTTAISGSVHHLACVGREHNEPRVVFKVDGRNLGGSRFRADLILIGPAAEVLGGGTALVHNALHAFEDVGQVFLRALELVEQAGRALADDLLSLIHI